nr:retrotransposable element Tf2 [Tanacetum cinerariifolium]
MFDEYFNPPPSVASPVLAVVALEPTNSTDALHNAIMEAGGKDRPPMLAPVIERLKKGESITVQDLETNLYWEFGKFTSWDGESLKSYYSRFYKMMNELVRNQYDVTNHQVIVQFLLQLQPKWQRFVTLVKQSQELKTISYHKLYDILKQHRHEVNEIKAEILPRIANPLTLVAQQQPRELNMRQRRWFELLKDYNTNIQYHPGKANVVADALNKKSGMIAGIKVEEEIIRDLERLNIEFYVRGQHGYWACLRVEFRQDTRLVVPNDASLREAMLTEAHSFPFSIHPGSTKMYHNLKLHFWWSGMKRDVATFVSRCLVCQHVKIEHQRASGLLQPLDIPVWKWDEISMDFVTGLPWTQRRHDAIWVVVDHLTKSGHFLPIHKDYSVSRLAEIFQHEIVRLHSTPSTIISDKDPRFASCFWKGLQKAWGTRLKFSTAFHPQTDDQSERTIQTLEDMLRSCALEWTCNWDDYICLVEFA